ncbi:hypothetical protein DCCM_2717 [Desulfocucumis palustris]|uniref:Uncharacterized protein n=1 Tax=Desulfocucumis palustris TaxID=1898651 RepID=A0A2L2XI94_9FIRM|nr:hypothetical protein DCCM_2717 [Desulfocucumis palustris]
MRTPYCRVALFFVNTGNAMFHGFIIFREEMSSSTEKGYGERIW